MSNLAPQAFAPVELPSKYAKAIVGLITAVLAVVIVAFQDNVVTTLELANIGVAFLTAFGIYAIPNFRQDIGAWAKMIVAFAGTGLQALVPLLAEGHLTTANWLMVLLAAIGALAVGIVPNVNPEQKAVVEAQARIVAEERVYGSMATADTSE